MIYIMPSLNFVTLGVASALGDALTVIYSKVPITFTSVAVLHTI
jgi:hypothetical protein